MTNLDEIDNKLFNMGISKPRVAGTYFGEPFTGTVISERRNSVTYHEQVYIEIDRPIKVPGGGYEQYTIITRAKDLANGLHTLKII